MKSLSLFVISCFTALSIFAQTTTSTVTVTSTGNRNRQILVDQKNYSLSATTSNDATTAASNVVVITDLQPGQHTLQIVRNANNSSTNTNTGRTNTTTFTLRPGYNMEITINRDGSVQQKETRIGRNWGGYAKKTPMTSANFTTLLNNVKKQKTISARTTAVKTAFNNTNNYFTSTQAKQLIQIVSSQPSRLELAKLSYRTITDPDNFSDLDVLLTENNQDALASYVDTYKANNPVYTNTGNNNNANNNNQNSGNKSPMSTASYNALYNGIEREWRSAEKMTALTNAFTNTNNYFTTNQAGRLIQLVSNENERLQLAKASYRSITDPANFIQINELLPSQASRDALVAYVTWYTGNNSTVNNTNTGINKTPMATATFNKLIQDVRNEWMPGAKMNLLTSAFANTNNYFSTNQAGQLIQLVSDEENRLQLAKSAYRTITDPANFTQLYQLFSYQSSKDALAAYVNSYNGTIGSGVTSQYKTPMSDANFNQILNDVKAQWLPFGKMNALTTTFANPEYYFTTSQTKQLIQLVSDEDNRLQLAKSAYRNMTDRANYTQLFDLFSNQASKDALMSYVGSYRDSAGY